MIIIPFFDVIIGQNDTNLDGYLKRDNDHYFSNRYTENGINTKYRPAKDNSELILGPLVEIGSLMI